MKLDCRYCHSFPRLVNKSANRRSLSPRSLFNPPPPPGADLIRKKDNNSSPARPILRTQHPILRTNSTVCPKRKKKQIFSFPKRRIWCIILFYCRVDYKRIKVRISSTLNKLLLINKEFLDPNADPDPHH